MWKSVRLSLFVLTPPPTLLQLTAFDPYRCGPARQYLLGGKHVLRGEQIAECTACYSKENSTSGVSPLL